MRIDGCKIVCGSARYFPAVGGGYGIKMLLANGKGDFLFGLVSSIDKAKFAKCVLNELSPGDSVDSSIIKTGVKFVGLEAR